MIPFTYLLLLTLLPLPLHGQHVVFEDVGQVATSLSYLHVALPLNLTGIRTLLHDYRQALLFNNSAQFPFETSTEFYRQKFDDLFVHRLIVPAMRDLNEVLAELRQRADRFDARLANLTALMPSITTAKSNSFDTETMHFRKKRFAPFLTSLVMKGVFGTIHGLYTQSKYRTLKKELNTVIVEQKRLIAASRGQDEAIAALRTESEQLHSFMSNLTIFAPMRIITRLRSLELLIDEEIDKLWDAVQVAQQHRLSIRFLPAAAMDRLFRNIQRRAEQSGNQLLLERPSDLFQIELSYCYDGDDITLILHTPMAPKTTILRLLKFLPFPFSFSQTHFLMPTPHKRLLAISSDEPRHSMELTDAELEGCYKVNNLYMCERQGILKLRMGLTCLGALYDQKFRLATELCEMKAVPITESVLQLNDNWFLVYAVQQFTAYITCRNSTSSEFHFAVGVNKISVSPTCSVKLQDHILHADTALREPTDVIQFSFSLAGTSFTPEEIADAEVALAELAESDDQDPTLDDLRSLKTMSRRFPRWIWFVTLAAVRLTFIVLFSIFGTACLHKYWLIARALKLLADRVWPRQNPDAIYDVQPTTQGQEDEGEVEMVEIAAAAPAVNEREIDAPRAATLPRRERRADPVAVERPLLGRTVRGQVVPVMGAHAVDFIRTASRRLRPRRGGQPDELPAAFRRNRLPLY